MCWSCIERDFENYIIIKQDVYETQISPILANSKDGQGHKDKCLDTRWNILSKEMLMCNMKALIFIIKKLWPMSI